MSVVMCHSKHTTYVQQKWYFVNNKNSTEIEVTVAAELLKKN